MEEFNYKKVAKEIGWCFDYVNYTMEQAVDFDYYEEVKSHITPETVMADIGCGSAEKACKNYGEAKQILLIDNEEEMILKANQNIQKYCGKNAKKFKTICEDGSNKPKIAPNSLDLLVSRHCGVKTKVIYNSLKFGGYFISQDIDKEDCWELKKLFNRGQSFNKKQSVKQKTMKEILSYNFTKVEILNFEQIEYYKTVDDLIYLLERTPILNYFDREKDLEKLQEYVNKNSTPKGIKLLRKLYAIKILK